MVYVCVIFGMCPLPAHCSILYKLIQRLTPLGLYALYTLVVLWEVTDDQFYGGKTGGGGGVSRDGGGRFAVRGEIIQSILPHIPSFYDKIKLPDLIKPCDVFVKLEKMVFDV